jgi:RNase P/RNase MRP subunit POP5
VFRKFVDGAKQTARGLIVYYSPLIGALDPAVDIWIVCSAAPGLPPWCVDEREGTRASGHPMTITKERFLLVRCTPLGEQKLPSAAQVVQASIRDSVQENFGDFGVGCILTLLQVRHYNSDTGLLLVRVAREHATMLRAALTLVCFVSNQPVRLTALSAAGVRLHPPPAARARTTNTPWHI